MPTRTISWIWLLCIQIFVWTEQTHCLLRMLNGISWACVTWQTRKMLSIYRCHLVGRLANYVTLHCKWANKHTPTQQFRCIAAHNVKPNANRHLWQLQSRAQWHSNGIPIKSHGPTAVDCNCKWSVVLKTLPSCKFQIFSNAFAFIPLLGSKWVWVVLLPNSPRWSGPLAMKRCGTYGWPAFAFRRPANSS